MFRKIFSLGRGKKPLPSSGVPLPSEEEEAPKPISHKPNVAARSPEAMCEIDPKKMSPEEIKARLAELYKRFNHAAGSLNDELRQEAEIMLDAIVACREKYVDRD